MLLTQKHGECVINMTLHIQTLLANFHLSPSSPLRESVKKKKESDTYLEEERRNRCNLEKQIYRQVDKFTAAGVWKFRWEKNNIGFVTENFRLIPKCNEIHYSRLRFLMTSGVKFFLKGEGINLSRVLYSLSVVCEAVLLKPTLFQLHIINTEVTISIAVSAFCPLSQYLGRFHRNLQ